MFKRPSTRRKGGHRQIELNLVPMIDALVTLIAFLMFTMSILNLASVESPFPMTSQADVEQKLQEKPLQLTLTLRENESEIWSPFEKIDSKTIPHAADGLPDLTAIHEALLGVKQLFPKETKIVLVPFSSASYETLISVIDALRTIEATDPPLFVKDEKSGNDVQTKLLFPEVVFGNLLGDG